MNARGTSHVHNRIKRSVLMVSRDVVLRSPNEVDVGRFGVGA